MVAYRYQPGDPGSIENTKKYHGKGKGEKWSKQVDQVKMGSGQPLVPEPIYWQLSLSSTHLAAEVEED